MDGNHEQELEDLGLLQKHVADRFSELLDDLLITLFLPNLIPLKIIFLQNSFFIKRM
jgi:hypothetical protein